jgi:cytochrome c-type biogenesis protein CcsB
MPIDSGLAQLSRDLLLSTVFIYAIAMLACACDFAFGRARIARPAPVLAGVGAAGVGAAGGPADGGPADGGPADGGPADGAAAGASAARTGSGATEPGPGLWVRSAFVLTAIGLIAQVAGIATRGISEDRVPWGNMYEFITAITCMAIIVLLVVALRYKAYYIGLFVLVPVVFSLGLALTVIYTPAGALVPALQSYWIAIHVTSMIVASGLFIVGAVTTAMYLAADRNERRLAVGLASGTAGIMARLPRPLVLDRLSYRTILFAFPVWTFGIMAGAIWADHAWGRYWGWDPKETWSFITWVVYAGFLHARATAGWRGRQAAYIQLAGFCCLMFNLIGINLWVTGLHSYAGMG